jgi:hypothetical protein
MPITTQCPGCNQTLSVPDQYAGARANCPSCGTAVTFPAAGAAPPPAPPVVAPAPPGDYQAAPAAAYPQPPAYPPGEAGYAAAAPALPRDNTELFNLIGIGAGAFFFLLLFISTFLRWVSIRMEVVAEAPPTSFSGTHFGDGRLVLLFSLLLGVAVGLNFLTRKLLPLTMLIAGAFGTFTLMVMLSHLGKTPGTGPLAGLMTTSAGAGIWVGLFAALGVMGACIWTAVRHPLALEIPGAATQPAFMRAYGALLGSQTVALVSGLLYWIFFAIS